MNISLKMLNFPAQAEIFTSPERYKIVQKGRRFGLTKGASNNFILEALERKFKAGLWVDTVNVNIDRYVERYFLPHLQKLPDQVWHWGKQAKVMKILDSIIDFRSADRPENIEGFGYDKAFLNEAGIILKNDYLWNNAIRPMLWEFKPKTVIGGTPKGKGLFFELAQRGKDPKQPMYKLFHKTVFDNPYMDHDSIREEMRDMPENIIRQEIMGEFIEDEGAVFRGFRDIATALPSKPETGHLYVMGVDLAKVQDFTVITVYDRHNNNQVYQDRFNKIDWNYQKKKIKAVSCHYNNALVMLDATGLGDPIADDLLRDNVPVEPFKLTNQSKKEIIEKLAIWMEQGKIKILRIPETLAEFENFTYDISSSGRIRYNAPAGFHDDIVIAHALAIHSLNPTIKVVKPEPDSLIRQEYQKLKGGGSSHVFEFNQQ